MVILPIIICTCLFLTFTGANQCYWAGTAPLCNSDCNNDLEVDRSQHGDGEKCFAGHKKYCCPRAIRPDSIHATVCEHNDFKGTCEVINVENTPCVNFNHNDWASSVNAHGGCVRLYEHHNCQGWSVALYAGNPDHNDLSKWNFHISYSFRNRYDLCKPIFSYF